MQARRRHTHCVGNEGCQFVQRAVFITAQNEDLADLTTTDKDYTPMAVTKEGVVMIKPEAALDVSAATVTVDLGANNDVVIAANSTGGCKLFTSVDLDESEEQISSGANTVKTIYAWNLTAAPLWLQLFNLTAANVTIGTTPPTNNYMIPANADSDGAGVALPLPPEGFSYGTALTVAITTGSGTNSGAPAAGDAGICVAYQD